MSDSDEADNIPSREVCESRCQEFAAVTGTDTALAMFYLQDRDWDLQRSVNSYFEEMMASETSTAGPSKKEAVSSLTGLSAPDPVKKAPQSAAAPKSDPEPHRIRLMSWNIDGLDQNNLLTRSKAACKVILQERPDVVYLQEVVPQSQEVIESMCAQYQLIPSHDTGYYTAVMLHCETAAYSDHAITPFFSSKMGRSLLQVKARVKGTDCLLITSHLESTKTHANERVRQLKAAFKVMTEADSKRTVLFGGDLNMRDDEIGKAGGIPDRVYDLWEVTGKREEAKFTWDTKRNDNVEMPGKFKPRCRFDRLYLRGSEPQALKPAYFELVGIERIPQCQRFPSDHWGLLVHFNKVT